MRRQPTKKVSSGKHPGSVWIEQHRASLLNNHWVAASANGLEASATKIDDLMNEIRKKGIHADQVAIAFITRDAL